MHATFIAYVDESGDEGFVFQPDGRGSSQWFVLSAVLIRKEDDLLQVHCLKEVRKLLQRDPKAALHFVDLRHEQRIPYLRKISSLPIATVSVLIHKPSIEDPEPFLRSKHLLYHHAAGLLMQQLAPVCLDQRRPADANALAEIVFSNRTSLSYHAMRCYLRSTLALGDGALHEGVVDPDRIHAIEHAKLAGLQVADAAASGIHFALKRNRYDETEPSYIRMLERTFPRKEGACIGYGLRLWPDGLLDADMNAPGLNVLKGL